MTEKEKVVFFVDYASIARAVKERRYHLDYDDLLHYISEGRFLVDAYCYVPINPRNEHRLDGDIEALWRSGYVVTTKLGTAVGKTYLCNLAVEITMDVCKVVQQMKPDILVLATSNLDFLALLQDVRKSGIRVEVAAFEETIPPDMRLKCSGFINLTEYYEGYLATQLAQQHDRQEEERVEEQYRSLIQAQEQDMDTAEIAVDQIDDLQAQEHDFLEESMELPAAEQTVNEVGLPLSQSEPY
jgi:uncharacterized LabA/DUF88 family protein